MKLLFFLAALSAFAQEPTFPATPLPVALAGFVSYNQLGSPRLTGGVSAIYPFSGSIGVYGTTTSDLALKKSIDPTTGRSFYAITSTIRQGAHKTLFGTGRFSFLVGGDLGPGFSQGEPSGISVDFSGSFVATTVYQISPTFSAIIPVRMLYVNKIGWNPVVEAGIMVNLGNLPKKR